MTKGVISDMSLEDYVNQRDLWYSSEEGLVPIVNMSHGHRALAARWLTSHATPIISVLESAFNESIINKDGTHTVSDVLGLMAQNSRTWMQNTPLYRALVNGLPEMP